MQDVCMQVCLCEINSIPNKWLESLKAYNNERLQFNVGPGESNYGFCR